ncbi:RNA polymerase sigma-70 factor [Flavivirga spongiicola]|uniref:RNA polymerase sigma-70 factor n=1 Tax=Flavivirga spongiicola TaxID=421621 RepID=A0ABU7XPJ4_9FLAO|nr:RNA polymerase sigma-70 factor [Flavivirga sp. MEBiC05379]MDO5977446.1 RNA polymerase sigma-70 factor [Flavivirga sp. MEBiC05379]
MPKKVITLDEARFYRFKKGDERAFEYFFNTYFNAIVGFTMQFLGDEDKSRSIAQEAFIKLWQNREKVKKTNGIKAFLYTSAKSDCLNIIRHNKVVYKYNNRQLQERENQINLEVLNSLEFDAMSFTELERLIEKSIDALPEKCKLIFRKRRNENKKNKEIAEELGISVKAVEANMTRALKILKVNLANYLSVLL